ncbi:MAG: hypothetical protein K6E91_06105 [Butyrivibrio sp.]|nr:hypothetical protein [Butyrivibrio sp.]
MLISYSLLYPLVLLAVILEYIVPKKLRGILILFVSFLLYYMSGTRAVYVLVLAGLIAYLAGLFMEKTDSQMMKKTILIGSIVLLLGLLIAFKYGVGGLAAPLGLSFFLLEAISYVADCYTGKMEAEKNPLYVFMFIAFFPTLTSGPIERGKNLIPQFRNIESMTRKELFDIDRLCDSAIMIIYGMFIKFVLADRLRVVVDTVFDKYYRYGTVVLAYCAGLFFIQLLCDFNGYSHIAIGVAGLFGIKLVDNFKAPFLSVSVTEFWTRWHISLSSWLRDYIYIPLGGNRKGKVRKYINLMITFIVSGLWHGNGISFAIWGGLNGLYEIVEGLLSDAGLIRKGKQSLPFGKRTLRAILTFALVSFAVIFFRADSTTHALGYIKQMFTCGDFWLLSDASGYFRLGLDVQEVIILCFGMLIMAGMDFVTYKYDLRIDEWLQIQGPVFRIVFVLGILLYTMVFGIYGSGVDPSAFYYQAF